ncbi:MAG: efflux RND transporter permease subunit [Gammaproteobacteria bacterium]|nr:efflux RND transporter permease subunit [Gammaproteobacteria bacterium]MYD79098.1 efflux RND transporter permease subunit [Gammaproteobacteria bacterium]
MIARIIGWSVDNRNIVLIATAFLVVGGVLSVFRTPVDAIPDLSDVQVIVKTTFHGQAPQVVEDQVTYPLSVAMLSVPHTTAVRGYSFFGDSYVYIIFEDGTDLYWARSRVLEYLNQVKNQLPPGVTPTLGPDATGVGWIFEYALVDRSGNHDLDQLRSLQDWFLKYELQTVPGVAEVATVGGMVKQYQIVVDPDRLYAFGLTLKQIRQAIQSNNQETGGSVIEMGEAEYMVRAKGYITGLEHLQQIPLGISPQGTPLQLSDVAELRIGPQMRRGIAELDGEGEVVGGIVVMRAGENALVTIDGLKQRLEELKQSLPDGVEIVTTYDRSKLITRSVLNLRNTLIEEFIVVALVCALFLFHLRSSLVVILSLPIAILGAFAIMRVQGINANIMSLGGIAIAVGAMVDGAIVMVENAHKRLEQLTSSGQKISSDERWAAIREAASELGPPIFFSLAIVTLSFLPVFTLEAQEGRLFTPLAFTKTYSMAVASVLAITLIPVLLGFFVRGRIHSEQRNPINRILIKGYEPILNVVLRFPKTILCLCLVLLVAGIWPATKLGSEFMPPLDEGDYMYMPTTHPGISVDKARELLQQTDKLIRGIPEVENVFGKVGRAETATDPAPLTMIETMIQLKPKDEWRPGTTMETIRDELNRRVQFPGLNNAWVMPIKTRIDMLATGIKTPVGIKISGPDLSVVETIGTSIERALADLPGTASVFAERVAGGRYIDVAVDRTRAARHGLDIDDVQEIVRTAIGGMNVSQTVEGLDRYPINIRYPQHVRNSLENLKMLPIITPKGARIALVDVADIEIADGPPVIKSENARPTGWLYVDILGRDLGSYVAEAREVVANEVDLPPNYSLQWSGQYEYLVRAQQRLAIMGPLTLAIVLLLLYLNFRRIAEVFLIIGTIPFALIGGVLLLYFLDYDISIAVGVGFIALAGVAVELGVVMLTYINMSMNRRLGEIEKSGDSVQLEDVLGAIRDGAMRRIRPILMTTLTVVLGLAPIMLDEGTGSEVMQRIAAPMFGGMISAMVLTLIVLPALYLLYKKWTLVRRSSS